MRDLRAASDEELLRLTARHPRAFDELMQRITEAISAHEVVPEAERVFMLEPSETAEEPATKRGDFAFCIGSRSGEGLEDGFVLAVDRDVKLYVGSDLSGWTNDPYGRWDSACDGAGYRRRSTLDFMSNADAADEWDVVVPEDGEALLAELRRHGVTPGERLRVRPAVSGVYLTKAAAERPAREAAATAGRLEVPAFFGSVRSGRRDLAERSEEILRADFPGR